MQNYSLIQKFLHDFVLKKKFINKSLFEIEKMIFLKDLDIKNQSHIFITGLPRSGTTSLLNFLFSSNSFASLTYKNMPFILSPNFSKIFHQNKISEKKERMHNDGINFDINSPEALDEIFFNNDETFIKKELLNYLELILISEQKDRYLSKNNLNFKRLDLISSILPNSKFLITIREPLQHAYSLLNQHLHFSKLQKNDDFVRRYMNYLGHNEFGLDHKPWNEESINNDFNEIDYWLEQWSLFYQKILRNYQSNKSCFFVIYEELTNQSYVKILAKQTNLKKIEKLNFNYFKNSNKKQVNISYSKKIYNNANNIYTEFKNQKILNEN